MCGKLFWATLSNFQLFKLEILLRWPFFTFIFNHSSNMNYFTYTSYHFTPHRTYELNKLISLPIRGFIAQLVEHRTGIAISNWLNWKIYCDDLSSLSSTTTVQIWIISYILHIISLLTGHMNSINWSRYTWLHSSVGRASHRYREGHGFESRWSPYFFRILLSSCLNWNIYCDDSWFFTFKDCEAHRCVDFS